MKKKFFLQATVLIASCVLSTSHLLSQTTSQESTPRLSNDQAFNLCYTSLNYWWYEAKLLQGILVQEREKLSAYEQMTGIQASSIEDLKRISDIQKAQKLEMEQAVISLGDELKKSNVKKKSWKVGTFVLVPSALVGGIIIGVKLAR